jgi:hypothetical protein
MNDAAPAGNTYFMSVFYTPLRAYTNPRRTTPHRSYPNSTGRVSKRVRKHMEVTGSAKRVV